MRLASLTLPIALLGLAACAGMGSANAPTRAVAVMHPTKGSAVRGVVTFTKVAEGMQIVADIEGLTPGQHGFHVHEFGDASGSDGKTAGGHFNPHDVDHALPDDRRHVGDLGNLEADSAGRARYDRVDTHLTFHGATSILGRGLVIHAKPDDGGQPTGNAGARVAVGVIGAAKPGP